MSGKLQRGWYSFLRCHRLALSVDRHKLRHHSGIDRRSSGTGKV